MARMFHFGIAFWIEFRFWSFTVLRALCLGYILRTMQSALSSYLCRITQVTIKYLGHNDTLELRECRIPGARTSVSITRYPDVPLSWTGAHLLVDSKYRNKFVWISIQIGDLLSANIRSKKQLSQVRIDRTANGPPVSAPPKSKGGQIFCRVSRSASNSASTYLASECWC
jgi:hypothetical protein